MKKIVILGGGTAGWVTALFLQKFYKLENIAVVEDPNTPPIIAGESAGTLMNSILDYLDIDHYDWVESVNALPKLGSKLVDEWLTFNKQIRNMH
jgi:glycine/D-amino acid oxidase-like deaminating enzyme